MSKSTRILTLLLAALMLSGMISCAEKQQTQTENTSAATSEETTTAVSQPEVKPNFEPTDWKGENFNILYPKWGLYTDYFAADEQTGDQMNDAIYERKLKTEEYLGIKIVEKDVPNIVNIMPEVKKTVLAGTDDYQLVLTHCIQNIADMITSGYLYDWNSIPYVDMSKNYWNKNVIDNLSLNGHSYYAVSDYMISDPNAILFNKQMITDYDLENPYDVVKNGDWTLDKLIAMSGTVSGDINGDGIYNENDLYGLTVEGDWILNSIQYGCDQYLVSRGADGTYLLDLNTDKMYSIIEKLYNFFNVGNSAYAWKFNAEEKYKIMIESGRTLFNMVPLHDVSIFRTSEIDFGILPFPKYDTAQSDYISNDWSGFMCIPTTVKNHDMIGMANEVLAYYSGKTTIPAFYDILLNGKLARDDESVEMLNIIYGNVVYDAGMNYFGFSNNISELFFTLARLVVRDSSSDFASWYTKYESASIKEIAKFTEMIEKLQ